MKSLLVLFIIISFAQVEAQQKNDTSLRSVLLEQLKSTHNKKDWFVPANDAVKDLTPEQAMWTDGSGNHSVGQLTNHLVFWNERQLADFKKQKLAVFNGNNDETFNNFDSKTWPDLVKRLDAVMTNLEKLVELADEASLKTWAPIVANISTHNAYHTGQIIFVRKLQGSWNPDKGVK
jgi:uncharacterized damage-inducible protein DinB